MRRDRAVSTVLDVGVALLLISASIILIGTYVYGIEEPEQPTSAEQTATTIATSTITVEYDRSDVTGSSNYTEPEGAAPADYRQTEYGPAATMLADAAVANATWDGEQVLPWGGEYENAVSKSMAGILVGVTNNFYVLARWEPYDGSSIRGEATAGFAPPRNDDVRQASLTVSSGMPTIDAGTASETVYQAIDTNASNDVQAGYDALARTVAESMVEELFPPVDTQVAIEGSGVPRELKVFHYQRLAEVLDVSQFQASIPTSGVQTGPSGPLRRSSADATAANERIEDGLAALIREDIEDSPIGTEIEQAYRDHGSDQTLFEREVEGILDRRVAVGEVTITVSTWSA